ncbi:PEBP-like protein [Amniculicola lignicola CBS 123094]|uniref:PEBP-like protein n=1 Tax=Amniculicola lignicola CBS 123094 TaxID=1392246 RepID=A0A6A5VZ70_9PLEO|nr:PEBP-like protein [Amniculicola lignicola CBS 123094]
MLFPSSLFIAALVGATQAQTPPGFKPQVTTKLNVIFNSTSVTKAGELLTKTATATAPNLALTNVNSTSDTYLFIMIDLDVPGAGSNSTRRTLLHAMTTGFKTTTQKLNGTATLLSTTQKGPAAYFGPGPPSTDTIAHRYVQLLFKQPANLNIPATMFAETTSRLNFNIEAFMKTMGLAAPVAGNFFTVDGRNGTQTGSGGRGNSTVVPFTGAAGRVSEGSSVVGLIGVLGAMVLLV